MMIPLFFHCVRQQHRPDLFRAVQRSTSFKFRNDQSMHGGNGPLQPPQTSRTRAFWANPLQFFLVRRHKTTNNHNINGRMSLDGLELKQTYTNEDEYDEGGLYNHNINHNNNNNNADNHTGQFRIDDDEEYDEEHVMDFEDEPSHSWWQKLAASLHAGQNPHLACDEDPSQYGFAFSVR